ncbi:mechanosensitive ion channel protein [Paucilactobacillus hokkaidonensis JCM 18461]|uniref:Mechanosensitive ion channel protein n=2 Tax=Paucilactobacillus hokkaidonensis TaxID=1193095 RepID=A0A0A1GYJ9_9LACO|nr:MscS mechanosensitive ion channel [Paucilactobacillus hokkaidonensis]BAP86024.1 mechanosensitive ion channel protein [Paucilactobacillus hokkaidonensis JCM 18461]
MNQIILAGLNSKLTQQAQNFTGYFTKLDWETIGKHIASRFLLLITVTIVFGLVIWIGKVVINHTFKRYKLHSMLTTNRTNTIHALTLNIFRYTCFFFYLYAILSLIGVPVGTLIAGAGIFSIALGLGAQGFVNDVVTGFFILLEQQLDVGDIVEIGTIKGTVTTLGIRTTQVTSPDGTLNFIPNRNITIVSNFSRNNMRVLIDIKISTATPLDQLKKQIEQVNDDLVPQFSELQTRPDIIGPTLNQDNLLVYRIILMTANGTQEKIRSSFLAAYLSAIRQAGIELIP